MIPFNDLKRIHGPLTNSFMNVLKRALDSSGFIGGKEVTNFERAFGDYCGVGPEGVAGVSNGTDALELTLRAMKIGEGDEVITAANTFYATASAIRSTGATPVLADINPDTHLIDVDSLEGKVSDRVRAIVPVHLYGQQAEMEKIENFAKKYGLLILEDAAQAHGSLRDGFPPGHIGGAVAYSFYPGKNLGALGDAGAVTSRDKSIIADVRMLREYGQAAKYHHEKQGFNHRLDALQAAFLSVKLPELNGWNVNRQEIAGKLIRNLSDVNEIKLPVTAHGNSHTYHLFVIRTANREGLKEFLEDNGVQTGIHYPVPIHEQRAFAYLNRPLGSYPNAETNARQILSLPIFPGMVDEEINYVSDKVKSFFGKSR